MTGSCRPEWHYMMDLSKKLDAVMCMVEGGDCFTINRPRQYGKTTLLQSLETLLLSGTDYLPLVISFENVGNLMFKGLRGKSIFAVWV